MGPDTLFASGPCSAATRCVLLTAKLKEPAVYFGSAKTPNFRKGLRLQAISLIRHRRDLFSMLLFEAVFLDQFDRV